MKKRKRTSTSQRGKFYSSLPAEELDRIAAPFDKEMVPTRPLTPAMRAQGRRAKRKRGRPVVGEGAEKVLVTLERGLLRETDAYAKKHRKNRSQLVAEGLRAVLGERQRRRAS
jgi:hypothetical protein